MLQKQKDGQWKLFSMLFFPHPSEEHKKYKIIEDTTQSAIEKTIKHYIAPSLHINMLVNVSLFYLVICQIFCFQYPEMLSFVKSMMYFVSEHFIYFP